MPATKTIKTNTIPSKDNLLEAFRLMCTARKMASLFDEHKEFCGTYVHATSTGHEAIQLAAGMLLQPIDFAAPYYRDESILLAIGLKPSELMMQLMAKKNDPFSGGRTYYGHAALKRPGFPTIPHQSSATGMQTIPATGMAHGLKYLDSQDLLKDQSIVLCSLGDGSVTEGEVAEALQMAVLKELPIVYLIQDNDWSISANGAETRTMDAYEYAAGFKGLERMRVDGTDFEKSYEGLSKAYAYARYERKPILVHANCPLLGHHTSGVRREWYRNDLKEQAKLDPLPKLEKALLRIGETKRTLNKINKDQVDFVLQEYELSKNSEDPDLDSFDKHEFAPEVVLEECGIRSPKGGEKVVMVDAALHAVEEILRDHPEALFYGQDVGGRLGGVFREAASLAQKFGHERVFNTPIQEAYIVGSTAGMSTVGAKPIVEIQFADYIWPGLNQLVEELSKSCYLSMGKFPIQSLIRIPIGAYGGGGPYHSGSIESTLLNIRGIKIIYPSNAADMKGLMKSAFYDPNPVISLEHKGLYWSKVPGTDGARMTEPDSDYMIPLGKARVHQTATEENVDDGTSMVVITYGMGVHWAQNASANFEGQVEIIDLRTLNPIDWEEIVRASKKHSKVMVLTEESLLNSFAESLAGRISQECFQYLDGPVRTLGAASLPAIPLNKGLESMLLPSADKVAAVLKQMLED